MKRVAIIGNGGGGKTTLAKKLSKSFDLPLTHVDSIQFLAHWKRPPVEELRKKLNDIAEGDRWIIDGFGPMDVIEERFKKCETLIFVDFPIWRHYWWATKRCIKAYRKDRDELPEGCSEKGLKNARRLFRNMWYVHRQLRGKLIDLMNSKDVKANIIKIQTPKQWKAISNLRAN